MATSKEIKVMSRDTALAHMHVLLNELDGDLDGELEHDTIMELYEVLERLERLGMSDDDVIACDPRAADHFV